MKKLRKKVLIFDVDGVLLDSRINMLLSWKKVQEIFYLKNKKFEDYFRNIGLPFYEILKLIGIKNNHVNIKKIYKKESLKQIKKIKNYKGSIQIIKKLNKKQFSLNIVTSKDIFRTKKFLNKNLKYFDFIECNNSNIKGKPNPDQINFIISNLKAKKSDCVYIGDTHIDYLTAKNSKIDFIFAQWGYGKNYNYKYKCKDIKDLPNLLSIIS